MYLCSKLLQDTARSYCNEWNKFDMAHSRQAKCIWGSFTLWNPYATSFYVFFFDVYFFSSGSHDRINKKQRNIQPENQVLTREVDKEEKEKVMCKATQIYLCKIV